eukprot:GHVQ01026835.1.p2 GENE.GHVQ01026835.1~~GHVQ01026835.1.p2  ORF type:complete len:374 (-),score=81.49 GHVQ01026835.1:315-1436(-)
MVAQTLFSLALLFLLVLWVTVVDCATEPAQSEKLPWLESEDSPNITNAQRNCEVCQVMSQIITTRFREKLPPSLANATSDRVAGGKKGRSNSASLGMLDVIVQDVLDPEQVCTFSLWKPFADKTDNLFVYDMTATCQLMVREVEEELETHLPKLLPARDLSQRICLGGVTDYCGLSGLWKQGQFPEDREEKEDKNQRLADLFLEYNRKQPGVIETESGLQYKKIEDENGEAIKPRESALCPESLDSIVKVHYRGTLLNGKEFDSSHKRGDPAEFTLNQVIKGWGEGLQLMCEGDKLALAVPPHLAYGTTGAGKDIGPNMAIKFEVDLIKVLEGGKTRASLDGQDTEDQKTEDDKDKKQEGEADKAEADKAEEL